jgi:DNA polymerase
MPRKLHLDIETYSECDLKREGLYRYAEHPSTELLVVCYAFDEEPVQTWVPEYDPFVPEDLRAHIARGGELRAHNASFERVVLNGVAGQKVDFPQIRIEQCVCTAAKMAAHGLPRALGNAAEALGTHPKNDVGRMDMLQLSKPRSGKVARWTRDNAPERFERLDQYCVDDVEAERGIDRVVPDLSAAEQEVYRLDQRINDRGIAVDLKAVEDAQVLIAEYKAELQARCREWTGLNPSQSAKLADWVREHGYPQLPDLQADTVKHAVRDAACPPDVQRVLRLYSTYNAKAVSKYEAIERAVCADGRLRGMFLYHGAGTGRWSSQIVQLQNLFRPVIEDPDVAVDCFASRDLDWLRSVYSDVDPMKVLASCVRAMLVPGEGRELQSIDFAGVESRGTAWLFDEEWALQAFRAFDAGLGPDSYKLAYARAFRLRPDDVTKPQRQVGKVLELSMGYEGGASAFATMAANYGVDLAEMASQVRQALSPEIVESAEWMWQRFGRGGDLPHDVYIACDGLKQLWRASRPKTVQGWRDLKEAAMLAIQNPGTVYAIPNGKVKFRVKDQWLQMRLPSGRSLHYFRPQVDFAKLKDAEGFDTDDDDPRSAKISYMGVDTYTRRWMRTGTYGGKLCENAVQALSRDLLVHALFNLERAGYPVVGTVHDEVISEVSGGSLEEASELMCRAPAWAAGFPVAVEGWRAQRYRK